MHRDGSEEFDINAEIQLIEELIETGDRGHAAHHLSGVVGTDPLHTQVSSLIDALITDQHNPEELANIDDNRYFGTIALNAMILFRIGHLTDAIARMLQVQAFRPAKPFIGALFSKSINDSLFQQADADIIAETISDVILHVQDLNVPDFASLKDGLETVFQLLTKHHPQSEPLAFAESMFARRIGDTDRARAAAQRPRRSSYRLAIALASANRIDGDIEAANEAYQRALAIDPNDTAVRLDLGDMYLGDGQLVRAEQYYREVVSLDPESNWANASLAYVRGMLTDDPRHFETIEEMAKDEIDRARHLHFLTKLYETWLPDRPESILKVPFHDIVRVAISSLEAPSAIRIARKLKPELNVSINDIPEPDPRIPRQAVEFVLWSYPSEASEEPSVLAEPNLPPPAPRTSEAVADLAEQRYHISKWFDAAKDIAIPLGTSSVSDLLSTMIHPPKARGDHDLENWFFRIQVAAALIIARLDNGWDSSVRQNALFSLIFGPVDWTSTAGVIALTQIAIAEPELVDPIAETLLAILRRDVDSPIDFMCLSEPIVHNMLRIPNLPSEVRQVLVAYRNNNLVVGYF